MKFMNVVDMDIAKVKTAHMFVYAIPMHLVLIAVSCARNHIAMSKTIS